MSTLYRGLTGVLPRISCEQMRDSRRFPAEPNFFYFPGGSCIAVL